MTWVSWIASRAQQKRHRYIYPAAPFAAGEDVIVRVDPEDANSMMLWGKR